MCPAFSLLERRAEYKKDGKRSKSVVALRRDRKALFSKAIELFKTLSRLFWTGCSRRGAYMKVRLDHEDAQAIALTVEVLRPADLYSQGSL